MYTLCILNKYKAVYTVSNMCICSTIKPLVYKDLLMSIGLVKPAHNPKVVGSNPAPATKFKTF